MTHKWIFLTHSIGIFANREFEWCLYCGALKIRRYPRTVPKGRKLKNGTQRYTTTTEPTETYYNVCTKERDYKREPKCKP